MRCYDLREKGIVSCMGVALRSVKITRVSFQGTVCISVDKGLRLTAAKNVFKNE